MMADWLSRIGLLRFQVRSVQMRLRLRPRCCVTSGVDLPACSDCVRFNARVLALTAERATRAPQNATKCDSVSLLALEKLINRIRSAVPVAPWLLEFFANLTPRRLLGSGLANARPSELDGELAAKADLVGAQQLAQVK